MKDDEDKLVNAIIALHQEIKKQGERTEKQLGKINLAIGELRLSYIKLDDQVKKLDEGFNKLGKGFNKLGEGFNELGGSFKKLDGSFNKYAIRNDERATNHEMRIVRLEEKTPGNSYVAREPAIKYKRKKRN